VTRRSDESLDSSGDNPSSDQRSTIHHYPQRSVHTYYGDESDEGLVKNIISNKKQKEKNDFIYRIVCPQLIQPFPIIIIVCHMIAMNKMVINRFSWNLVFIFFILAYRQQLRERSQPSHIVCNPNPHCSNINFFQKSSLIRGIVSLVNVKVTSKSIHHKQLVFI
jgi:hypothetical protein